MIIKIPKLKSRYIPVYSASFKLADNLSWWDNDDIHYPNILINLDTIEKEDVPKLKFPSDMFLLTDSGGFQVIRGTCNYDWKTSAEKQIELGASKIFSFDIPPVKRKTDGSNDFRVTTEKETKEIIDQNIDVALKQSEWIKENYPFYFNRFCYVAQATSYNTLIYNFQRLDELIGLDNYSKYFPGGLACSGKVEDIIFYAITTGYLKKNFIDKGIYVHFLGIGSFQKMLVVIRNGITTFDSSNVLGGAIRWTCYNTIDNKEGFSHMSKDSFPFEKQFCLCPICRNTNYNELLKANPQLIGRRFILHNLYYQLQMNVLLDAIDKSKFTEFVKKNFKVNERTLIALEFCDRCEKDGFDIAYGKYKRYLKKDMTRQNNLNILNTDVNTTKQKGLF